MVFGLLNSAGLVAVLRSLNTTLMSFSDSVCLERKKLSRLEELCQYLTNRSASSLLSDLDDPTEDIQSIISQATAVSSSHPVQ